MDTNCTTKVVDALGNVVVRMFRYYNGQPSVHGLKLAKFLTGIKMVYGLPLSVKKEIEGLAEGTGCLAAQMVSHFKEAPGDIYLVSHAWGCSVDYEYTIAVLTSNKIIVTVKHQFGSNQFDQKVVFEGTPREFMDWVEE